MKSAPAKQNKKTKPKSIAAAPARAAAGPRKPAGAPAGPRKPAAATNPAPAKPARMVFLDQLRGYAFAGMITVNFLGRFAVMPWTFKHHDTEGMSYADTIAALFMFVVGMGFRVSALKRIQSHGRASAYLGLLGRFVGLTLVGIVFYGPDYVGSWWDALVDIGLAGVLAVPALELSGKRRAALAFFYLALFQALFTFAGYGAWTMTRSIDGGPLGPLSWVFMLLMGTLAADWVRAGKVAALLRNCLLWGVGLVILGLGLRAPWGDFKAFWYFSQKAMSAPYTLYSTGLSFLTLPVFYVLCERFKITFPTLTVMGKNALVLYILHNVVTDSNISLFPGDATFGRALLGYAGLYFICWSVARKLDRDGVIIKL